VFVPGRPFQLSIMLVGKVRNLPKWSTFQMISWESSWPYLQTLD